MRKATVEVPIEAMVGFAAKLGSTNLENQISGITEDHEIEIEIFFEKHESDEVDELEEYLEELIDSLPEEEEEEEED